MEPITLITTALVLGIVAGVKPTAEQAIKDMYEGLKTLIIDRYKISVSGLENKPESEIQQAAIAEQLTEKGVEKDNDVLEAAKSLLEKAEKDQSNNKQLEQVKIIIKNNKKFAFSYSGNATYIEK